jgi:putative PEP-CTERM system TPR-repeat lipoprotein
MKKTLLVSCILAALVTQGCGKKDAAQHLQDAQNFISKQEYPAAVIELKSALQQEPENAKVRLTLGQIYLQVGDGLSASKELQRAKEFGADLNELALPMAQAFFLAGQFPELASLGKETGLTPLNQDYIRLYQALSAIEASEAADAKAELQSLSTNNDAGIKAMASAQLQIMDRKHDTALVALNDIPSDNPLFREGLLLKAKLQNILAQFDASVASFQQYLKLNPSGHQARLLLAQTFVAQNKFPEASAELDKLLKLFPKQPLANYLKSVIAFEAKDFQKAKEYSETAINSGLSSVSTRVMAALASSQLGLSNQALNHLQAVRGELDSYPPAQKLFIALQLQSGNTDVAQQQILKNESASNDVQLVTATAFQLLKQRANGAAEELINKYEAGSAQKSGQDLIAIGSIKLGIPGQEAQGLQLLEQAAQLAPKEQQPKLLLASAYLQQRKFKEAEALATEWLKDEAMKVQGLNMLAFIALQQEQDEKALKYIADAVAANSDLPFTYLLKAVSEQAKQDQAAAKTTLTTLLDKHPAYLPALEQLYALTRQDSDSLALQRAEALFKSDKTNYNVAVLYARMLVDQKKQEQALQVLEEGKQPVAERHALHWALLIEHERVTNKDIKKSLAVAEQWYQLNSAERESVYSYIRALILDKQIEKALAVSTEELKKSPDDKVLFGTQVQLLAENGKHAEALKLLATLPAEDAGKADVQFIKGRILLADNKPKEALVALNESYQQSQSTMAALMIADTYERAGDLDKAKQFVEQHFTTKPNDGPLQLFYANLLLKSDKEKSIEVFSQLLAKEPDNVAVLNNLAWTLLETNKLTEATTHIEKAMTLAPRNPDVLDTYGAVLLASGKVDQAIQRLEDSLKVRPDHPSVLLNYADALIKKGEKDKAKAILDKITGDKSISATQVNSLKAKLN